MSSLPCHMMTLGFAVTTAQDFRHYVYQASEFGQRLEAKHGAYTQWVIGNGIELWVQTNLHRRIIGMNPHFNGKTRMRATLAERIPRYPHSILDGAFSAWANPIVNTAESSRYPFVFDLPDYDLYEELCLPTTIYVQLTAFAYELRGFETEMAYKISQRGGRKGIVESFLSSGRAKNPAQAEAMFSGRVLDVRMITNPVTEERFYCAQVSVLGSELDVVADPQVVQGKVVKGGVIRGAFWLSGRLI
jgi:hypothetical protein